MVRMNTTYVHDEDRKAYIETMFPGEFDEIIVCPEVCPTGILHMDNSLAIRQKLLTIKRMDLIRALALPEGYISGLTEEPGDDPGASMWPSLRG